MGRKDLVLSWLQNRRIEEIKDVIEILNEERDSDIPSTGTKQAMIERLKFVNIRDIEEAIDSAIPDGLEQVERDIGDLAGHSTRRSKGPERVFAPDAPSSLSRLPDVTKSKIESADFLGASDRSWNIMLGKASEAAVAKLGVRAGDVLSATDLRWQTGRFEDDGYRYFPGIRISIQGVEANRALANLQRMAEYLGIKARLVVAWSEQCDSHNAGKRLSIVLQ